MPDDTPPDVPALIERLRLRYIRRPSYVSFGFRGYGQQYDQAPDPDCTAAAGALAAQAAEIERLRAERDAAWQPIETAPHTGNLLVWCPDSKRVHFVTWWAQEGSWAHVGSGRCLLETVTHWQLPEPPEKLT